jgi:hypothetical protein
MSTLEDQLRDAFRADADTVRPESIPPGPPPRPPRPARSDPRPDHSVPGRPGLRRTRVMIPLAAAAAVLAIVAGLSLAAPRLSRSPGPVTGSVQPTPTPTASMAPTPVQSSSPAGSVPSPVLGPAAPREVAGSAPSPGVPRYYVTIDQYLNNHPPVSLGVHDTATGQLVGQLDSPPGASFEAIAAPAGDRTFVTAVGPNNGCSSQLYQFRLNDQGLPGPLVPLHITVPGTYPEIGDLAITPDGRTIAYSTYHCGGPDGELGVIDLATRRVAAWPYTGAILDPAGLSLSANGGLLVYSSFLQPAGAWILNTSAPAGNLLERSRVVSRTARWAGLAASGESLYSCAVSPSSVPPPRTGTVTSYTSSLATGHQQVVARWPGVSWPQCWASLDSSGDYLLVQYQESWPRADWVRAAVLDVRSGRSANIRFPASESYLPFDLAW